METKEQRVKRRAALPLWEAVDDLLSGVPEEEWAKLPSDMASTVDKELYGSK